MLTGMPPVLCAQTNAPITLVLTIPSYIKAHSQLVLSVSSAGEHQPPEAVIQSFLEWRIPQGTTVLVSRSLIYDVPTSAEAPPAGFVDLRQLAQESYISAFMPSSTPGIPVLSVLATELEKPNGKALLWMGAACPRAGAGCTVRITAVVF